MGDRYFLNVTCPHCGELFPDVYFAPMCGFVDCTCPHCGKAIDLVKYTGITAEDASNAVAIQRAIDDVIHQCRTEQRQQ